jgi:hypothetical protein
MWPTVAYVERREHPSNRKRCDMCDVMRTREEIRTLFAPPQPG